MTAQEDSEPEKVSTTPPKPQAPTTVASSFVRYVLGFGVWVALGLAPFLGAAEIPGFTPLLALYPILLKSWLIPLSGFLMGTIALIVEYAAGQRLVLKTARAWFRRSIWVLVSSLVVLVMFYDVLVTQVPIGDGQRSVAVVTGPSLPSPIAKDCGCREGMTNEQCVQEISLNPVNIKVCFGRTQVGLASRALVLLYLLLTSSFATSAGIVLLLRRNREAKERRKKD